MSSENNFLTRSNTRKFTAEMADDVKTVINILRKTNLPLDKLVDGVCGGLLGFGYVNQADHGADCESSTKKSKYYFENKRNCIPVKSVVLEDTSEEKARIFAENDKIILCSSAFISVEQSTNEAINSAISGNILTPKEKKQLKDALKDYLHNNSYMPMFQVVGKTTMIPMKKNRASGKMHTLEEASAALGDKRRSITYTYPQLLKAGFIVVSQALELSMVKLYFKNTYPRSFKHIKFMTSEEFNSFSSKGKFNSIFA